MVAFDVHAKHLFDAFSMLVERTDGQRTIERRIHLPHHTDLVKCDRVAIEQQVQQPEIAIIGLANHTIEKRARWSLQRAYS